jgi:hypothetical protein
VPNLHNEFIGEAIGEPFTSLVGEIAAEETERKDGNYGGPSTLLF